MNCTDFILIGKRRQPNILRLIEKAKRSENYVIQKLIALLESIQPNSVVVYSKIGWISRWFSDPNQFSFLKNPMVKKLFSLSTVFVAMKTWNYIFRIRFSIKNAFYAFFYANECANNICYRITAGKNVIYTIFCRPKIFPTVYLHVFSLFFVFFFWCWRVLIWLFHVYHQADDGAFVAVCNVNITIRDVNNHSPKFERDHYMATIAEDTQIGK